MIREINGAAGPGKVPDYNYIERSQYRGKTVHMINVRDLERALRETLAVQEHAYAYDHFHQPGLEDIISGWGSLSKRLTEIWSKGAPRRPAHGRGCGTCWPDLFILIDLGKCGSSQAYLIPGVSVIPGIPIIVFGNISLEPLIHVVEQEADSMIDQPHRSDEHEEWAEWVDIQADIMSEFDNRVYYGGDILSALLQNALVFRMPTVVVLPRSSLIEDIDPCEVAENSRPAGEQHTPPDSDSEVEADSQYAEEPFDNNGDESATVGWCDQFPEHETCQPESWTSTRY